MNTTERLAEALRICSGWLEAYASAPMKRKTPNVRGNAHLTAAQEVGDEQD